ncbi:hypothetical protein AB0C59_30705 [Streptomyces sp. NPDC048664]
MIGSSRGSGSLSPEAVQLRQPGLFRGPDDNDLITGLFLVSHEVDGDE